MGLSCYERISDCETAPALEHAALQDIAAAFGPHATPEAVNAVPPSLFRLIRSLGHCNIARLDYTYLVTIENATGIGNFEVDTNFITVYVTGSGFISIDITVDDYYTGDYFNMIAYYVPDEETPTTEPPTTEPDTPTTTDSGNNGGSGGSTLDSVGDTGENVDTAEDVIQEATILGQITALSYIIPRMNPFRKKKS